MASKKATYVGFTAGQIADYNGQAVKLIKPVAEYEGQTWRVEIVDGGLDHGQRYNIDPRHRHELKARAPEAA